MLKHLKVNVKIVNKHENHERFEIFENRIYYILMM